MATVTLGTGTLTFEPVEGWAKLPEGWSFMECPGVAVDSKDNVYIFHRGGDHPVMVFNREGNFLRSWGEGLFTNRTHGIHVSPDDYVYCVDDSHHAIKKFTLDGKLLLTIGVENQPAPKWGGQPFNRPTHMAVSPTTGEIYISDGYGNSRVHKYTPDGRHILSWGEPGCDPGQFQRPHNVVIDKADNIYIADRENNRVQVFDNNGKVQAIWHDMYRPDGICLDAEGNFFIGELCAQSGLEDCPVLGHRISVYNLQGQRLARFGDPGDSEGPGGFAAPHGVAVDSHGDIYVAEVSYTMKGAHLDPPRVLRSFQKLARVR